MTRRSRSVFSTWVPRPPTGPCRIRGAGLRTGVPLLLDLVATGPNVTLAGVSALVVFLAQEVSAVLVAPGASTGQTAWFTEEVEDDDRPSTRSHA
jgi:hypothetical protein